MKYSYTVETAITQAT